MTALIEGVIFVIGLMWAIRRREQVWRDVSSMRLIAASEE
jgi:hypothetical protein